MDYSYIIIIILFLATVISLILYFTKKSKPCDPCYPCKQCETCKQVPKNFTSTDEFNQSPTVPYYMRDIGNYYDDNRDKYVYLKRGNNGTVSCDTFCKNDRQDWGKIKFGDTLFGYDQSTNLAVDKGALLNTRTANTDIICGCINPINA